MMVWELYLDHLYANISQPPSIKKKRGKKRFMDHVEMPSPYAGGVFVTRNVKSRILVVWTLFCSFFRSITVRSNVSTLYSYIVAHFV